MPNANNWTASAFVYFNDPDNDYYNRVEIYADVLHSNNTHTVSQIFFWDGTMGDLNGCTRYGDSVRWSASAGETVTITVEVTKFSAGAVIEVEVPLIVNGYP
ncbi:MAG TPA: hypothetical protein VF824_05175 [Thermoanaerobaculia bacterium]